MKQAGAIIPITMVVPRAVIYVVYSLECAILSYRALRFIYPFVVLNRTTLLYLSLYFFFYQH